MLSFQILVLFFSVSIFAIIPIGEDRFISTKSYKVSSVQLPPQGFENYLQLLKASPQSKGLNIQKDSDNNNNGSSNSTVLNLKPGITTLQTDENNECYFVNTTIGKKEFPLIIDTGSAYLWVYGDNCTDSACQNNALYTPASSESSTSTFALAYVTGTASGQVVEDNIIVNKLATTQKFKFGKADKVPDFFKNYPVSGIFGLPSNDSSAIQSIISALYDSHAISIEKFSISLGNISNSTDYPNSGIFAIGDPIKELYKGDIHYSDLIENDSHYWLIPIESVTLDSFDVNFTNPVNLGDGQANSSTSRKAIVDSGTTVLALPKQDALDLHSYFTNSITDGTNFAILCNSSFNIGLNINGHDWTIEPENYLGAKYSDPSMAGYCVSNIQGIDSAAADSWILGAAFLKSVYAVFDVNNQQIGFATKNEDVVLTSTSTSPSSSAIQTSSAAYYGNSSSIMTSLSSNSSASTSASKTSHKAAGVALTSTHYFSIYSIIISFITTFML